MRSSSSATAHRLSELPMMESLYDFPNNTFTTWDYVIFSLVLLISLGIGIYYGISGGHQRTTSEFLMADRQMGLFPVTMSLLASTMSAITLLGTPAEIYKYGTQYWMIWIGYCLMIPITVYIFLPVFYELEVTSVFEYLQIRFGTAVRILACCCFLLQMTSYLSIVLYTPCLALSVVTGFNKWLSLCLVGLVCTCYTTIGGMKAVMWTDVFQMFMMLAGLFAVLIKGSLDEGGIGNIWRIMEEGERIEFFDFDPSLTKRHTFWSLVFGGCFTWLAIYGVNQSQVQRALCCPKLRQGQIALWLNLPGLMVFLTVCGLCGMVVYAEYRFCDPIVTGRIEAGDQLLPQYVMDKLNHPGLPGLFTACIFSGSLSTISSGLNSLSTVTLQDLVKGNCVRKLSERKATLISKVLAFSFGLLMIGLSFVASQLGGVLQAALALYGMIAGPVLGLFTLAVLYPWANHIGSFVGTLVGLIMTLWLGIGAQVYKPAVYRPPINITGCPLREFNETMTSVTELMMTSTEMDLSPDDSSKQPGYLAFYEISYIWYSAFAIFTTTVVGLLVSACTGFNDPKKMDPRLIHPLIYNLCCCTSGDTREKFKCRVGEDFEMKEDTAPEVVSALAEKTTDNTDSNLPLDSKFLLTKF